METAHVEPEANPYELEIAIVDDLEARRCRWCSPAAGPRASRRGAACSSTATLARGAAGCVTDGFVRDILEIRAA